HPWIFLILLLLFIVLMIWLLPRIWRAIKWVFAKLRSLLGGPAPPPLKSPKPPPETGPTPPQP
ncbi:MAG: DUF4126 domain-containing protein, partial [Gammaproteobacteria bacterium]